jgi:hypothetical protein
VLLWRTDYEYLAKQGAFGLSVRFLLDDQGGEKRKVFGDFCSEKESWKQWSGGRRQYLQLLVK